MAEDIREVIVEAARTLLMDKKKRKLTVKDIVEECGITRQAFYYYFEDIPDMIRWSLEQSVEWLVVQGLAQGNMESCIRYFLVVASSAKPLMQRSYESNYGVETEKLVEEACSNLFERIVEECHLYDDCTLPERKFLLRYHSQAIMGILKGWNKEDTANLDFIVHQVQQILTGKNVMTGVPLTHSDALAKMEQMKNM